MDANSASAILFPGQGVGDASSRELVSQVRPDLLDLAADLVGEGPFERMSEGTAFAQPAVYCASISGYEQLGRPQAEYFAGHSLGEIGALAAAGAIDDADGLRIVVARGRVMDEAVNRYLARELGPRGIRANLISAGPIASPAAGGIPGFDGLAESWPAAAPLGWDGDDPTPVARAVCFLLSDWSEAISGELIHVDGGAHAVAMVSEPRAGLNGSAPQPVGSETA